MQSTDFALVAAWAVRDSFQAESGERARECPASRHQGHEKLVSRGWHSANRGEVADDTNSPYVHTIASATPVTIAHRAQYFNTRMRTGPFSDPAIATITV